MIKRRILVLMPALLLASAGAAPARADPPLCSSSCKAAPAGSGGLFVLSGHGWGHGVGMSQYGAYGFAQHGWSYTQIVTHYYPGTTVQKVPPTQLRVLLADGKRSLTIESAADFEVEDGAGTVHKLSAGSYSFGPALKLKSDDAQATSLPSPLTFKPGTAPLELGRPYRGSIELDSVGGKLRAINTVGLEQYLYGVVPSEMPFRWASEALKSQAVVARSYALATRRAAAPFDVYSDTRSQMYLGMSQEKPNTTAAVDATAGEVATYNGQVAKTYFYSTSGGRTANFADIWTGEPPLPYLVTVADPYDSISPYHDWGPVSFTAKQLARRFRVSGGVTDALAAANPSGRVAALDLIGPSAQVEVPGPKVRTALKLRSTWFGVSVLSLVRSPPVAPIEYGASVQLTGVARGFDRVELEQRQAGGAWEAVSPVTPAKDGTVTLSEQPTVSTEFRLATEAAAAAPVRVRVAPHAELSATDVPGQLTGSVQPVVPEATVEIQHKDETSGAWTTVTTTTTVDASGNFTVTLRPEPGLYRARVAPAQGLVAGTTPALRLASP